MTPEYKKLGRKAGWTYTDDANPDTDGVYECSVTFRRYSGEEVRCVKQCRYSTVRGWTHALRKSVYAWRRLEPAPVE